MVSIVNVLIITFHFREMAAENVRPFFSQLSPYPHIKHYITLDTFLSFPSPSTPLSQNLDLLRANASALNMKIENGCWCCGEKKSMKNKYHHITQPYMLTSLVKWTDNHGSLFYIWCCELLCELCFRENTSRIFPCIHYTHGTVLLLAAWVDDCHLENWISFLSQSHRTNILDLGVSKAAATLLASSRWHLENVWLWSSRAESLMNLRWLFFAKTSHWHTRTHT